MFIKHLSITKLYDYLQCSPRLYCQLCVIP